MGEVKYMELSLTVDNTGATVLILFVTVMLNEPALFESTGNESWEEEVRCLRIPEVSGSWAPNSLHPL